MNRFVPYSFGRTADGRFVYTSSTAKRGPPFIRDINPAGHRLGPCEGPATGRKSGGHAGVADRPRCQRLAGWAGASDPRVPTQHTGLFLRCRWKSSDPGLSNSWQTGDGVSVATGTDRGRADQAAG